MLWQVLAIALLFVAGNCEEDSGGCDKKVSKTEEVEDAKIQLKAMMSSNEFEITVSITQDRPKDYEMKKSGIEIVVKNLTGIKVESLKAYITETENCSMWMKGEDDIDISDFLADIYDEMANGSDTVKNSTSTTKNNATKWMDSDESDMMDLGNLFDLVGSTIIITNKRDEKQCGKLEIDETEGIEMFKMKFLKSMEYCEDSLTELIAKRTSLPDDAIQILKMEDEEDCAVVGVYFNAKFNNTILKKLYTVFASNDELGIFSPTEKCMTEVEETFISKMIVERFLNGNFDEDDEKDEKDLTQICSSVGVRNQIEEYNARVRRYDRAMDDWIGKYGSAKLQYDERMRKENKYDVGDYSERDDEYRRRLPSPTERNYNDDDYNSKSDPDAEFKILARYIGMNEGRELTEKRRELNRITQKRGEKTTDDYNEMRMILQKIRELTDEQEEVKRMTKYGLCLVSNMGNSSFEKLQEIKKRFEKAEDWEDEGDKILKEMILYQLSEKIEKVASKEIVLFDNKKDLSERLTTMTMKLQKIFRVDANCSTEEERYRVGMAIGYLKYIVPGIIKQYYSEFNNTGDIETFLVAMNNTFTKDFEETSKNIWVAIYTPGLMSMDNNSSFTALSMLNTLSETSRKMLLEKVQNDIKTASVENLMKLQTLMMTEEEIKMKCSLKDLAARIRDPDSDDEELPCDRDSERDEDSYDEYNYRRGANYRRDDDNRRNAYYRRTQTPMPYEDERADFDRDYQYRSRQRTTTRLPDSTRRGRSDSDYDRPSPNRGYGFGQNNDYRPTTRRPDEYPSRRTYDNRFYGNSKLEYDGEYRGKDW